MTLAICISCGHRKFGAWPPCVQCGFDPSSVLDRVRSMALTDHFFKPRELDKFAQFISSGNKLRFNPSVCTILGEKLAFEDYFSKEADESACLPCMRCETVFSSKEQKTLCPVCDKNREKMLSICPECKALNEMRPVTCGRCEVSFSKFTKWSIATPKSLAQQLSLITDRLVSNHIISARNSRIMEIFDERLFDDQLAMIDKLRLFLTYCGLQRISAITSNPDIYGAIEAEVLYLCDEEWSFGASPFLRPLEGYFAKFDEYQNAAKSRVDAPSFALASFLAENCLDTFSDLELVIELVTILATLPQMFDELIPTSLGFAPSYRDAVATEVAL